jgi:hypothetical protein
MRTNSLLNECIGDYALVENPLLGHYMIKKVKRVF